MNSTQKEITVTEELKDIVVIYHKYCPDGFASAWIAKKKFGDNASYIALKRGEELYEGLKGKEVYMLDFSYPDDGLKRLESIAKKLVVIDHHESAQKEVEAVREHLFSLDHAGAYLSWQYFFPETKVPTAVEYLSASDNGNFGILKDQDLLTTYITSLPYTDESYGKLMDEFESEQGLSQVYEKAHLIESYQGKVLEPSLGSLHTVLFEGYTILAVNTCLPISERSQLLRTIYDTHNIPFALSYRFDDGEWKCSLRSDGKVDVSELAKRFGGGGHRGSAGFSVKAEFPLPFAILKDVSAIL